MTQYFLREMEKQKKDLLALSAVVEENVYKATRSVLERDTKLAKKVIEADEEIDKMEVDVEEECLKILALHQPVANDLRFVVAVLKINNDLERIGDLAVNIAERAVYLAGKEPIDIPFDLGKMVDLARTMLKQSLDALVKRDSSLARQVLTSDDEIDELNRQMYASVQQEIIRHPERLDCLINLMGAARQLERIADHTTNIAEDVIYMIDGTIVRHGKGIY